jgi:hypothetical protein
METYTTQYGEHITRYRDRILEVIHKATNQYSSVTALRVDLHYPAIYDNGDTVSCFPNTDPNVMARFTNSLKAKLDADYQRKLKDNGYADKSSLRYVWVREFTQEGKVHYHTFLFLYKKAYYHLGDYDLGRNTLRTMITTAWDSALGLGPGSVLGLVEYPINGKYDLLARDIRVGIYPGDLLNRIDYLTKVKTKVFEDDYRSFGCSNG